MVHDSTCSRTHTTCCIMVSVRVLAPSDPPTIVTSQTSSSSSVYLRWQPPSPYAFNGIFLRYEVAYWEPSPEGSGGVGSAANVEIADPGPRDATSFTIEGLEKYEMF